MKGPTDELTGFAALPVCEQWERQSDPPPGATVEIGRASTRNGLLLHLPDATSSQSLRIVLLRAFDLAARERVRLINDPGWWAVMVAGASIGAKAGARRMRAASMLRPGGRAENGGRAALHAVLVVEPARRMVERALWPLARLKTEWVWEDLRRDAALQLGPSDQELLWYAEAEGIDAHVDELLRAFSYGVIEWAPESRNSGWRGVQRASALD